MLPSAAFCESDHFEEFVQDTPLKSTTTVSHFMHVSSHERQSGQGRETSVIRRAELASEAKLERERGGGGACDDPWTHRGKGECQASQAERIPSLPPHPAASNARCTISCFPAPQWMLDVLRIGEGNGFPHHHARIPQGLPHHAGGTPGTSGPLVAPPDPPSCLHEPSAAAPTPPSCLHEPPNAPPTAPSCLHGPMVRPPTAPSCAPNAPLDAKTARNPRAWHAFPPPDAPPPDPTDSSLPP
ncbi:hypothetical protein Hsar01_02058 [Haloferula sargassicola]|uniref:Uncharacterized protein n=1 Tax=Haloferula sargassicola TaxID=490096 RepID=A0ABP9US53_9BACT